MSERSRKSRGSTSGRVSMMAVPVAGLADNHLLAVGGDLVACAGADLVSVCFSRSYT